MDFARTKEIAITNAGGTKTITVDSTENFYIVTGTYNLVADCDVVTDVAPPDGTTIEIWYIASGTVTPGVQDMTILGTTLTAVQALKNFIIKGTFVGGTIYSPLFLDFSQSAIIETLHYVNKSLTLAKMADATRGMMLRYGAAGVIETFVAQTNAQLLIGNGADIVSVPQSGHVLFANTGQSAIQALVITNAMCSATMALALSKLASGTAAFIIVYSAGGVATAVAMGGDVAISDTGVTTIQPTSVEATMLDADTALVPYQQYVSFASGELQGNEFEADFDGIIVSGEGSVATTIGITDAAIIQFQIDGVNVTNGDMSFPATSIVGTKLSCTPSAANTFIKGQVLSMDCAKVTANGGRVNCKMLVRRT